MRIIFAGTPEAAVPTLTALIASTHDVALVVTRPPARSGRGRAMRPSAVAQCARGAGLAVLETASLKGEEAAGAIGAVGADLGVVVAYGGLVPPDVLAMPAHGWVNLHFSDLPRWRGAAPVQWAVLSGDPTTASCVFALEEGLDTGPVYSREPFTIGHETSGELLDRMAAAGGAQVLACVDSLAAGTARATAQSDRGATRARRLTVADGYVSFDEDALATDRRVRAVTPNPGAWTLGPGGGRIKLGPVTAAPDRGLGAGQVEAGKRDVHVGCAQGCVRLGSVAPAGKGWMDAAAWARGARLAPGARMGGTEGAPR